MILEMAWGLAMFTLGYLLSEWGFRFAHSLATKEDLNNTERNIMATQEEVTAALVAAKAHVDKIGTETRTLLTRITELLAQIAANQSTVTPELQAAVDDLQAQLQVVDDLVPDN